MTIELIMADWLAPEGIVAVATTRSGGVSTGDYESLNLGAHVADEMNAVAENRRRLVAQCGLPAEPFWLTQVHGSDVVRAESDASAAPEADAVISSGGPIGILTADCLPIVVCAADGSEIAALHCGWRSLSSGIVANTIETMSTEPGELMAWLGPAISQPSFEVGDDVRDSFLAGIEDATACFEANENERWQADLYRLARLYLRAAGVSAVFGGGLCTYADSARFFSYRRDGQTGRMATIVFRRAEQGHE